MSDERTYIGMRGEWQDLVKALAGEPRGLGHLKPFRAKLAAILERTTELTAQQLSAEALASRRAKRAKKTPAPDAEAATPAAEPTDR